MQTFVLVRFEEISSCVQEHQAREGAQLIGSEDRAIFCCGDRPAILVGNGRHKLNSIGDTFMIREIMSVLEM